MKKRLLSIIIILILLTYTVNSVIPYKQSLTINNYKIKQVECSTNYLRILVESKTSSSLNLVFTIHTTKKETNKIFTNQLLKSFESNFFLITTNKPCNEIKRIDVNGYINLDNQNIIYLNSESSYKFTGKESSITTTETTTTEITQKTQTTQQITPTKYSYTYFNNKILSITNLDNNNVNYFHQDHLGSNRVITDNNGNIISKNEFTPFGNEVTFSSTSNYKFTGKEQDTSKLYYFGSRYYDKDIGRFTSVDPILNPIESSYSYARNNPVKYVDPDGKEAKESDKLYLRYPPKEIVRQFYRFLREREFSIMASIERELNIRHKTIPDIVFRDETKNLYVEPESNEASAHYNPTDPVVVFNNLPVNRKFFGLYQQLDTRDVKEILTHEITHHLTFEKVESIQFQLPVAKNALGDWPILEGIAVYFERRLNNIQGPIKYSDYSCDCYPGGYRLAAPIIDRYGERGIRYLLTHTSPNDLSELSSNIREYQEQAFKELQLPHHREYREEP